MTRSKHSVCHRDSICDQRGYNEKREEKEAAQQPQLDMTRKEIRETLEAFVDKHTMSGVLCMLSEIASEKESHVREDETLAKTWRKVELALDRLHINIGV